ncbi:pancreatic triacylglycerol lipase-like isoform X2 [Rhodnius prolixus]|uniref:Lipase domain-containing protein n=1 Tax=Rhodnius prolixus TaxID=13249 RepID=T1H9Y2_RHOPR
MFTLCLYLAIHIVAGHNSIEQNKDPTKIFIKNSTTSDFIASYVFNVNKYVHFLLHTRELDKPQEIILYDVLSVLKSNFDPRKKTKILVHGWLSSAYIQARDYNIIVVDWSTFSYQVYPISRYAINYVGPHVSKFIDFLIVQAGLRPEDVHILGHSLGAHIAGIAGIRMKFGKVARITGMDPAGPLIHGDSMCRLDSSDAHFVDVIHTSIHYLGVYEPLGHADFYPNGGGPLQPGCGFEIGICTHRRSYRYYIESIFNEHGFPAQRCNSWDQYVANNCSGEVAYMGENVSPKSRGRYYLRTATSPPFALGVNCEEKPTLQPYKIRTNDRRTNLVISSSEFKNYGSLYK